MTVDCHMPISNMSSLTKQTEMSHHLLLGHGQWVSSVSGESKRAVGVSKSHDG